MSKTTKPTVPSVPVPADAARRIKSFAVHKVGRKWLEVTDIGKTFKMKLAITPETAGFGVGDTIKDLAVGEIRKTQGFGTVVEYYPFPADDTETAEQIAQAELQRWLGYVEDAAKDGRVYQKGVDRLRELSVGQYPELQARLTAALAKAGNAATLTEIGRWLGYVEEHAAQGLTYHKGIEQVRSLGITQFPALLARLDAAAKKVGEVAAQRQQDRQKAAQKAQQELADRGERHIYLWSNKTGSSLPRVGWILVHKGEYVKILEISRGKYYGEDAMSFGGTDDEQWQYRATIRAATDEEAAPVKAQMERDTRRTSGKRRLNEIMQAVRAAGSRPAADPQGETVYDTFNPYGGGERIVIGQDLIWVIDNNGTDGGDWSHNNVRTGGAGAIGYCVPADADTAQAIRDAVADLNLEGPTPAA